MKKGLALFDFDGTITTSDSLREFIVFARGWPEFLLGACCLSPVVLLEKLQLVKTKRAKEMVFEFFFKQMPIERFNKLVDTFVQTSLPTIVNPLAMEKIQEHLEQDDRVVVVSASPELWVAKWAEHHGLECVGTRLAVHDDRILGTIDGENCKGDEKVLRISQVLDISDYSPVYAYGDSKADLPMLRLANFSFYKPFRKAKASK